MSGLKLRPPKKTTFSANCKAALILRNLCRRCSDGLQRIAGSGQRDSKAREDSLSFVKLHARKTKEGGRDGQPRQATRPALRTGGFRLGCFVRSGQPVTQSAEGAIHRMAAMQESEDRSTAHADFFKGATDAEIASGGDQPSFEGGDRFRGASSLVIHFRQIQIKLRVIVFHSQRFAAERFRIAKSFFGERREQARCTKDKMDFWVRCPGRAGRVGGLLPIVRRGDFSGIP